ncbi:MAG: gene transfer agent family protein [Rhodobiaceae bacterium]|nr:gene transfer agent family protein [Rhodobiaceae bacterium]MCC0016637.1 gene transfer agent family protein [Rhodobiaceae bacterium]MCC0042289.1 gene transfer agent family protein [Rhodobiaceae bacterium]
MSERRANRRRGEIEAELGGERRILCLTLGALAELETAFGVDDLASLAERFSSGRLSSRDFTAILAAALRGGGNSLSEQDIAVLSAEGGVAGLVAIVSDLFAVTFGQAVDDSRAEGGTANPPPAASPGPS